MINLLPHTSRIDSLGKYIQIKLLYIYSEHQYTKEVPFLKSVSLIIKEVPVV